MGAFGDGAPRGEQVQDGQKDRERLLWRDLFRFDLLSDPWFLIERLGLYWLLIVFLIAGTNIQTNEEVGIKLVSIIIC